MILTNPSCSDSFSKQSLCFTYFEHPPCSSTYKIGRALQQVSKNRYTIEKQCNHNEINVLSLLANNIALLFKFSKQMFYLKRLPKHRSWSSSFPLVIKIFRKIKENYLKQCISSSKSL